MSSRRGQMFVVTTIFLVGFIFVVQQLLFQYMSVDPKVGFEFNEYGIVKSLAVAADAILQGSSNCAALERDIEILKSFVDARSSTGGYSTNFKYTVNCDAYGKAITLPSGTTDATISLDTDKNANCRYSANVLGVPYDSMTAFSITGGTSHSTLVTGLSDGGEYHYYVRCQDEFLNTNTDDYEISFLVANP